MTDRIGQHGHGMLTCTVCGAIQPLAAAYEKPEARAAWEAALGFADRALTGLLIRYLDLFAAPGRAPQERTVARVLEDLAARIHAAQVTSHGIAYGAPREAWEDALRLLVSGQTQASLPLRNNAYLAGIVWRRADAVAAKTERQQEAQAASGVGRRSGGTWTPAGQLATTRPAGEGVTVPMPVPRPYEKHLMALATAADGATRSAAEEG